MITDERVSAIQRSVVTGQKVDLEVDESALFDAGADVVNQAYDEPLIVDGAQRRGEHLPGLEQMMQVRLGVTPTGVAVAFFVNRREGPSGGCRVDIEPSSDGIHRGIASDARGCDAVEGIGTVLDRGEDVVWF